MVGGEQVGRRRDPFPSEALRQWVRDFYQHNKMVKGKIRLRGRRVEL
jgi:polyhydroxyalkanoate synthase subunit PhaC